MHCGPASEGRGGQHPDHHVLDPPPSHSLLRTPGREKIQKDRGPTRGLLHVQYGLLWPGCCSHTLFISAGPVYPKIERMVRETVCLVWHDGPSFPL